MLVALALVGLVADGGRPASAQLNCNPGVRFYPGGAIHSCTLNGHHRLHTAQGQPVTCSDGHLLVQYESGRLQSCVLAQPLTVGSLRCAGGTRADFGVDGALLRCVR